VEIRKSSVPNGGLGRFACEPIPKGAPVRIDRVQPLEEFLAENSPGSTCPGGGIAVELRSAADIDRWCEHFAFPGAADDEVKDIELKTSWFIAGVPAARTDRGEGLSYVLAHSFHTNHNTEAVNVVTKVRDGHLIHEASQDVRPGDELFLDYTNMDLKPFVKEWCTKREGLSDVQSFARKLALPWEQHSSAGFQRKVEIRKSSVPNGGLGRFACEPIPKGAPVRIDRVQPLEEFLAENSPGSTCPGGGIAVELRSAADIDRWCEHFAFPGAADDEVKDIELKTSWFIAGVPAARTDRGEGLSYVLAHSFHTNHNTEAVNVVTKVRDGHLIHEASQDVRPGDELFLDYTNMDLKPFVKEWCTKREGLSDVQSFARKLLQQSERQSTI